MYGLFKISGRPDDRFFALSQNNSDLSTNEIPVQTGDLLRVFNSISKAEELLKLKVNFDRDEKSLQQYQAGFDRGTWTKIFFSQLPARLQKPDGRIVEGQLEPFFEQGMECIAWSLYDFERRGYDSLHVLGQGDLLTVFTHVTDGNIEWEDSLKFHDEPEKSGRNVMIMGPELNLNGDKVEEKYRYTAVNPDRSILEGLARNCLPAQVIR